MVSKSNASRHPECNKFILNLAQIPPELTGIDRGLKDVPG